MYHTIIFGSPSQLGPYRHMQACAIAIKRPASPTHFKFTPSTEIIYHQQESSPPTPWSKPRS